jgi:hypothetical protein
MRDDDTRRRQVPKAIKDYLKVKEKERCAVCKLPRPYLEQLRMAREEGILQRDQVEYLVAHGFKVTAQDLMRHINRRHEDA